MAKLAKIGTQLPKLFLELLQTVAWWMVCLAMVAPISGTLLWWGSLIRWDWVAVLVLNLLVALYLTQPVCDWLSALKNRVGAVLADPAKVGRE